MLSFMEMYFQTVPSSFLIWSIYTIVIGALFGGIKLINWRLHHTFDTTECFEDNGDSTDGWSSGKLDDDSKTSETATSKLPAQG